jgi:hypothetical protein
MDVIIAQEYYMHVLEAYASNGKACVEELTSGLPVPFASVSLLVELLISQMLLPAPPLMVFAYQSILVRLVEVVGQPVARCALRNTAKHCLVHFASDFPCSLWVY